jgi:hypothetical protein
LAGDGFFEWVEWGRLFQMGWMGTAFSNGLNGNGIFDWVEWGRLFHMSWMGTAFSNELNEDDFSNELNENHFFKWVEWKRLLRMKMTCPRFRAQRVVRALSVLKLALSTLKLFVCILTWFELISKLAHILVM